MPAPKEPTTKWGIALRKWRREKGWTQPQLAEKAGVTQGVVSAIETGDSQEPEMGTWEKLCNALGREVIVDAPPESQTDIPVFAFVAAGDSTLAFTDQGFIVGDGMYRITRPRDVNNEYAMALEIRGNSMEPKYQSGQIVIADITKEPSKGDFAIVGLVSGERFIKRWRKERGRVFLESINPEYPPIEIPAKAVKFAYKIIWVRERYKNHPKIGMKLIL